MLNDLIQKKLEQMSVLLVELKNFRFLFRVQIYIQEYPSAKGNFQLVIELASDINVRL